MDGTLTPIYVDVDKSLEEWHYKDILDIVRATGLLKLDDTRSSKKLEALLLLDLYTYPQASKEALHVIGCWLLIAFAVDDATDSSSDFEKARKLMEMLHDTLLTGVLPRDTPISMVWKFCEEFCKSFTMFAKPGGLIHHRYMKDFSECLFTGDLTIVRWRRDGKTPSLEEYLEVRPKDSGLFSCEFMSQIASSAFLPESVYQDLRFVKLRTLWVEHIAYVNDIFSYHKEVVLCKDEANLVFLLQKKYNFTLPEAVHYVICVVNYIADDFNSIVAEIRSELAFGPHIDIIDRYIKGLSLWINGHIQGSWKCERYCDPLNVPVDYGDVHVCL